MTPINKNIEPITPHEIAVVISELSVLQYFPADKDARTTIAQDLLAICPNIQEARWLSRRMRQLFNEWPGPRELRAVYCSRNRPRDGYEVSSLLYLDGVPTPPGGSELAWYPTIQETPRPLLPAGHTVTADLELENQVRSVAAAKDLNRSKPALLPNPNTEAITQADIDRAVIENRNKRAAEELHPTEPNV